MALKVCFRSLVLPLLARQRFGLYYNMPVVGTLRTHFFLRFLFQPRLLQIDTCSGTGFFHAFNRHILRRLKFPLAWMLQSGDLLARV